MLCGAYCLNLPRSHPLRGRPAFTANRQDLLVKLVTVQDNHFHIPQVPSSTEQQRVFHRFKPDGQRRANPPRLVSVIKLRPLFP